MRPAAMVVEIVQRLDQLDIEEIVKRKVKEIIQDIAINEGIGALDRLERVAFARRLLDLGVSRPTARMRVMAAYNVSASTADRVIAKAINSRKNREKVTRNPD